jgi:hypothetical protein
MVRRGSRVRVSFRALSARVGRRLASVSTRSPAGTAARLPGGIALCLGVLALVASPVQAARPLTTGVMDVQFGTADPGRASLLVDQTAVAGATIAKIGVNWRGITGGPPANAADPSDPAYDFSAVDRAVRAAAARGLEPMLLLTEAPSFAEGPDRPIDASPGSWRPSPSALASFARAVATRYSGTSAGPGGLLPRVRYYQAWNEPNLAQYLTPQSDAPTIYRDMLNAFYGAVKAVSPENVVVTAGTAPYGEDEGIRRTHPLVFWRDLLCINLALKPTVCPVKARFDVLAHNPINTSGSPRQLPDHPEDVTEANFGSLRQLLRAAEHARTIAVRGPHRLWATELWWETNPPDRLEGISPSTQARRLQQSFYALWRAGASTVIYLSMLDGPYHPDAFTEVSSSGLLFEDGTPKPAFTAFRFPFVTTRVKHGKLIGWGRAPTGGKLRIRGKRFGHWKTVAQVRVDAGDVFKTRLPADTGRRVRAEVGGETSLTWRR